jgi:hypothetical protein
VLKKITTSYSLTSKGKCFEQNSIGMTHPYASKDSDVLFRCPGVWKEVIAYGLLSMAIREFVTVVRVDDATLYVMLTLDE